MKNINVEKGWKKIKNNDAGKISAKKVGSQIPLITESVNDSKKKAKTSYK